MFDQLFSVYLATVKTGFKNKFFPSENKFLILQYRL